MSRGAILCSPNCVLIDEENAFIGPFFYQHHLIVQSLTHEKIPWAGDQRHKVSLSKAQRGQDSPRLERGDHGEEVHVGPPPVFEPADAYDSGLDAKAHPARAGDGIPRYLHGAFLCGTQVLLNFHTLRHVVAQLLKVVGWRVDIQGLCYLQVIIIYCPPSNEVQCTFKQDYPTPKKMWAKKYIVMCK